MITDKFNQNIDMFIEADKDLKLNAKYFSAAAMNPFVAHNSSPRGLMFSSHVSQIVAIDEPEENMVQTGLEYEFGKYVIGKVVEGDSEVISVIKRYNNLIKDSETVEYVVIYRNITTGIVDCLEIPQYNKYHPYFGFRFKRDESLDDLMRGDTLEDGKFLAKPPTVFENGGYGFGRDLKVAQLTLPKVDEDGFIISDKCAKMFKYRLFDKRTIEFGDNSFLLNLYGDEDNYKPFPEIGEYINDTGAVVASRDFDELFSPGLYSKKDVMDFNPIFDNAVYTRGPGGKVIDIKVYHNHKKKKTIPTNTDALLNKYHDALVSYYKQLINAYESVNSEYRRSTKDNIEVGNTLNTLLIEAYGMVESSNPNSKLKKNYKKDNLDLYRVEFTIEYVVNELAVGAKLTDQSGNKIAA